MNKLYLVTDPDFGGYDTYDSMVVSAPTEIAAREIHPSTFVTHVTNGKWMGTYPEGRAYSHGNWDWIPHSEVHSLTVVEIGTTDRPTGVVLASFNAG